MKITISYLPEDAAAGQIQRAKDPFIKLVKGELGDRYAEIGQSIVDITYTCYTDAYNRHKGGNGMNR